MTRGRKRDIRHVEACQHLDDPGDRARCRGIDRLDDRVRLLGVLDAHIERVGGHLILVVFGSAGGLVVAVDAGFASAYFVHGKDPPQQE